MAIRILPAGLASARFAGPFESSEDIDLADVQIPPSAPLSGRVVDESGKPIPGARVLVIGSDSLLENDARVLVETRTEADGSFSAPEALDGPSIGSATQITATAASGRSKVSWMIAPEFCSSSALARSPMVAALPVRSCVAAGGVQPSATREAAAGSASAR